MKSPSLMTRVLQRVDLMRDKPRGLTAAAVNMEQRITDDWFRSHFVYASDKVNRWLSKEINVSRSRILDFGCGDGVTDLGLALRHSAKEVIGIDLHDAFAYLATTAKTQIGVEQLPSNLRFETIKPGEALAARGPVDAVFSWSVFEHVEKQLLPAIFADIFALLPRKGLFFLQIEPLYLSPFGSHLSAVIAEPWMHLLESHDELLDRLAKAQPRQMAEDKKDKTFDVCSFNDFKEFLTREYLSLNKITLGELLQYVEQAGFIVEKKKVKNVLHIPSKALLERYAPEDLLANEVVLLLRRP